jgi:hypothetical protein
LSKAFNFNELAATIQMTDNIVTACLNNFTRINGFSYFLTRQSRGPCYITVVPDLQARGRRVGEARAVLSANHDKEVQHVLSLNPLNIVHRRTCCEPVGRLDRRAKASALIIGAAAGVVFGSVGTLADPAGYAARLVREHHACAIVVGLRPHSQLYDACMTSLDQSLSELDQARLVSTDRQRCAQQGFNSDTPAFADCVVDAEQVPGGPAQITTLAPQSVATARSVSDRRE